MPTSSSSTRFGRISNRNTSSAPSSGTESRTSHSAGESPSPVQAVKLPQREAAATNELVQIDGHEDGRGHQEHPHPGLPVVDGDEAQHELGGRKIGGDHVDAERGDGGDEEEEVLE